MKIIKPSHLSLLHKAYRFKSQDYLVVVGVAMFSLLGKNRLYKETEKIADCYKQTGHGLFDFCMPKKHAEFLAMGSAYAPEGEPLTRMQASISLGKKSKTIEVRGDSIATGFKRFKAIKPFVEMPLGYDRAYGGKGCDENPVGTGYAFLASDKHRAMPNLRYPGQRIRANRRLSYKPAAFGPLGVDWPGKISKAGTYDKKWLQNDNPGFPGDIDWAYFNQAAEDQFYKQPFHGDESFEICGMHPEHPEIKGRLPGIKIRIFANQIASYEPGNRNGETVFREVDTQLDTVWFYPDKDVGVILYRGELEVADSDALDVEALMLAYEEIGENTTTRSLADYEKVFNLRTDRETAIAHLFNEAQLSPPKSAEQKQAVIDKRLEHQKKQQEQKQATHKALSGALAKELAKDASMPSINADSLSAVEEEKPLINPADMLTPEEMAAGDFDLTPYMDAIKSLCDDVEQQKAEAEKHAAQRVTELKAGAGKQAKAKKAEKEKDEQLQKAGEKTQQAVTGLAIDDIAAVARDGETADEQRATIIKEKAERIARKMTVQSEQGLYEADSRVDKHLRTIVVDLLRRHKSLRGRDLAGADLSGLDFSGMDLREVMLENANLKACNFSAANLESAVLTGSCLDSASFVRARLAGANLSSVNGEKINFSSSDMAGVSFIKASITQSRWQGVSLADNQFVDCELIENDFTGANLCNLMLAKSHLQAVCFDQTIWRKANIVSSTIVESSLGKADMQGVSAVESGFERVDFQSALMQRCVFGESTRFIQCNFDQVVARETGWRGVDFSGSSFVAATFAKSDLANADFDEANLKDACMYQSLLNGANARGVEAANLDACKAMLRKANFSKANLKNSNLVGADTFETRFINAAMRNTRVSAPIKQEFLRE